MKTYEDFKQERKIKEKELIDKFLKFQRFLLFLNDYNGSTATLYYYGQKYTYRFINDIIPKQIIDKVMFIFNKSNSPVKALKELEFYASEVKDNWKDDSFVQCPGCKQEFAKSMNSSGEICPNCGKEELV